MGSNSEDGLQDPGPAAEAGPPTPLTESDSVRRDMSYSPASETETDQKQKDPLPETLDDDIDAEAIRAVPGTGGPDDAGDIEVDPEDLNLPGRS